MSDNDNRMTSQVTKLLSYSGWVTRHWLWLLRDFKASLSLMHVYYTAR